MTNVPPLSAAVLAGGQSRRMGRNKALLPLTDGGPPLLELVLERLRTIAGDLLVVASEGDPYREFGARVVPDTLPGGAALGGIHAALTHAQHSHCLVVGCDMPFLNPFLLRAMAGKRRGYDVLVPRLQGKSRQSRDGFIYQTLHAVYGRQCLPAIDAQLATGNRQVIGFFDAVRVEAIEEAEIQTWDPELRSFFNANTPEALDEARKMAANGTNR